MTDERDLINSTQLMLRRAGAGIIGRNVGVPNIFINPATQEQLNAFKASIEALNRNEQNIVTSTLVDAIIIPNGEQPLATIQRIIMQTQIARENDEEWESSGLTVELLGKMVEQITGETMDQRHQRLERESAEEATWIEQMRELLHHASQENNKVKILDKVKKVNYDVDMTKANSNMKAVLKSVFCKGCRRLKDECDLNCEQVLEDALRKARENKRIENINSVTFFEDFLKDELLKNERLLLNKYPNDITLEKYIIHEELHVLSEKDITMIVSFNFNFNGRTFHQRSYLSFTVSENSKVFERYGDAIYINNQIVQIDMNVVLS